jgi:hypothetical protein
MRKVATVLMWILHSAGNHDDRIVWFSTMIGENRQLVTNEPVEFEK